MAIPYIAIIDKVSGEPDFRVTDTAKRLEVVKHCLCQLCGEKLGRYMFFVGGPVAFEALQYYEPACHLDCVLYAMQVCPFILGKMEHVPIAKIKAEYAGKAVAEQNPLLIDETGFSSVRSPLWIIVKAGGYITRPAGQTFLMTPHPVLKSTKPLFVETMVVADWREVHTELLAP